MCCQMPFSEALLHLATKRSKLVFFQIPGKCRIKSTTLTATYPHPVTLGYQRGMSVCTATIADIFVCVCVWQFAHLTCIICRLTGMIRLFEICFQPVLQTCQLPQLPAFQCDNWKDCLNIYEAKRRCFKLLNARSINSF